MELLRLLYARFAAGYESAKTDDVVQHAPAYCPVVPQTQGTAIPVVPRINAVNTAKLDDSFSEMTVYVFPNRIPNYEAEEFANFGHILLHAGG